MTGASTLHLVKHHGLGNDFLVLLADEVPSDAPALAARLCRRHHGVGADGLLVATPGVGAAVDGAEVDAVMTLFNADGSLAEMSGNGIRCFVHALARARGLDEGVLRVATGGGARTVRFAPSPDGNPDVISATVDMGPARPGPVADPASPTPTTEVIKERTVDLGNPHVVLLVPDPALVDLAVDGPVWEHRYPHGANVHVVAATPGRPGALTLRVWERGAGLTEACGTGACAAAVAAHDWGLVGDEVVVQMPGGDVTVSLGDTVLLAGPSQWIADLEVPA
jgi:diaminopimelate epimerase